MSNKARPLFLTTICILSFIGIAIAIISSIFSYFTINSQINMAGALSQDVAQSTEVIMVLKSFSAMKVISIITILANIGCFVGVISMWMLKKTGFYIYSISEIIVPISGIIVIAKYSMGGFQTFSIIASIIACIAFIIMYGLNLKHMN